jgi:hypothetical protein
MSMKRLGWKKKHHIVGGTRYSLDDIEHNILRPLKDLVYISPLIARQSDAPA